MDIRKTIILILLAAILAVAISSAQDSGDPTSPAHYSLMEKGTTLHYEGIRSTAGYVEESRLTFWNSGTTVVDGRLAHRQMILFSWILEGEEHPGGSMASFQVVNDSVSESVARQYYGEEIAREEYPYVDLAGPLALGQTWTFPVAMPAVDANLPRPLIVVMESEVVEVGVTLEVPAGVFHDCLRVIERGRSRDDVRLVDGPHAGRSVDVTWEIERYWAPGLGSIKEISRQRTLTLRKPVQVLSDSEYQSNLLEVEKH